MGGLMMVLSFVDLVPIGLQWRWGLATLRCGLLYHRRMGVGIMRVGSIIERGMVVEASLDCMPCLL